MENNVIILHNSKCSKSREGWNWLEKNIKNFTTRYYLTEKLTYEELVVILSKLKISAQELVRKDEKIWKENYKDKTLTETEIIQAMIENPNLIQRPIVIKGNKAVIGRPLENINNLF